MSSGGYTLDPPKSGVLAELEEAESMPDEERVNKYFYNLYVANVSTDDIIGVMRRFESSPPDSRNSKTYRTMLKILFNECRFFPKYPVQELAITAELFGKMIKHCLLLSNGNLLMLALRCIIEALKRGKMSKMFQFGTIALSQFETSIANYPWFSTALLDIPDVRETFPQLYKTCEKLQSIMTDSMRGTTYVDQSKGIIIRPEDCEPGVARSAPAPPDVPPPCVIDKDRLDVGELESLMNCVLDDLTLEVPPVAVVNQIYAAFNNMSMDTAAQKAREVNDAIEASNLSWLLLYIVKTRASKEQNLHDVFVLFIENIKAPKVFDMAIQITYSCISACLKHIVDQKELPSYRTLLKNLGSWLGRITIGRNIPIMSRRLDLKQVLFHAYENGAMVAALPFVCKIMEHVANSKIFKPPNPWTTAILNFLVEIHSLNRLKTSLVFEVEVLFKHLDLGLENFANKTQLLESRVRPDVSIDFDPVEVPSEIPVPKVTEVPKPVHQYPVTGVPKSQPGRSGLGPQREASKDSVREKLNLLLAKVMREGPGVVRPNPPGESRSTEKPHPPPGYPPVPPIGALNGLHMQPVGNVSSGQSPIKNPPTPPLSDFAERVLHQLQSSVVISPSIAIFELQPQLRACVPLAIDRAIRRVIPVVSEHALSISRATTRMLISNDFAGEEDESTLRVAIQSMMEYFAKSLVIATCKEPLRIAFHESLRAALQTYSTQDCNTQVLVEQLVQIISQDNIVPAVAAAEKIVGEQAVRDVDSVIPDVLKLCKTQHQQGLPISLPPLLQQWNRLNVCMDKRNLTLYRNLFQNGARGLPVSSPLLQHLHGNVPRSMPPQPVGPVTNGAMPMSLCNAVMSRFEECFAEVREPLREIALFPPSLYSKSPTEPDYEPIMFSTHALLVLYSLPVDHDLFSCIAKCLNVMENSRHSEMASIAISHRLLTFLCEGIGAQAGLNVEVLLCVLDGLNQLNPGIKQSLVPLLFSQPLDRGNTAFNVVTVTGLLRYNLLDWSHLVHYLTLAMDKGRNSYAVEMAIVITAISVIDQRSIGPEAAAAIIREIASIKCGLEMCETYSGVLLKDARSKLLKDYMDLCPEPRLIIVSLSPILKRNLAACVTGSKFKLVGPTDDVMSFPETVRRDSHLDLGFGGVRRIVPPPPVSDSHRAIVSIIFAKWIESSLPYDGENLLLAWRQFFQRFNLQSLFKMDGGTDNFFAICVGSAIGTMSSSSPGWTVDQLDDPGFPSEGIDSLIALAKMADVMLRLVGGSDVPPSSALQKLLASTASLVLYGHDYISYYKLWVVLMRYFDKLEVASGNIVCRITFLTALRCINPTRCPEFVFFWLRLIWHPSLLKGAMAIPRCWSHVANLLLEMTCFMDANRKHESYHRIEQWCLELVHHVCDNYPQFVVEYYFCIGGSPRLERAASSCYVGPDPVPINALSMPVDHLPAMTVAPPVSPMIVTLLMRHGIKSYADSVMRSVVRQANIHAKIDVQQVVKVLEDVLDNDPGQGMTLVSCFSYYIGIEFPKSLSEPERIDERRLYVYLELLRQMSNRGRYVLVNAISRHLRYPNLHTHFFSCLLLWLFDVFRAPRDDILRQIILRVLLEQGLSGVKCPWGVRLTVVELFRNPRYKLGGDSFKSIPNCTRALLETISQVCSDVV
ncbi:CCR4-Not complex component Not1 family protein [Babesia bovis T2Bo]|uniref:Transcriptional regulatory protein, putative n=1 Tax=Babesia bovis TaxID=5865 RepID=A7AVT0_BABBO|nr:CCR4-Not complex component Not1 family protein [Babesia bovis T2Bo]EDO05906.1 CCR4-Not complex component Not1 family protein [Babesia bovis T2Bo]|eukprot:XP_001609474.1 transcriptional regulatory protein [Babesia bovis T2Bo]